MSISRERRENYYVRPDTKELLEGYAKDQRISKSSLVNEALKEKFDKIPPQEKERLRNIARAK